MDNRSLHAQYAEFATDVDEWFSTAENLLAAAEALQPKVLEYWAVDNERNRRRESQGKLPIHPHQVDLRGIYFMLTSYAIENLCKGLLISQNLRSIQAAANKGRLPPYMLRHDLSKLLRRVGFDLTSVDEELAFRLERSAVWSARYPVPTHANHQTVRMRTVPTWHNEDDVEVVKDFVARVDQFIIEELKKASRTASA